MGIGTARPLAGADIDWSRWYRPLAVGLTVLVLALTIDELVIASQTFASRDAIGIGVGSDFTYYRGVGQRWLVDGTYYLPEQLAGPYPIVLDRSVLYPPSALFLFVPFVWLPAVLWWTIPIGVLAYALWRWRPAPWAWPLLGFIGLFWPRSLGAFLWGNSDMWVAAGVAGGLLWGWPAAAIVLKPPFGLLALVGVRHRSWWIAAGLGVVTLALQVPLWLDYVVSLRNSGIPWDYSLYSLPLALAPIVAWLASERVGVRDRASTAAIAASFGSVEDDCLDHPMGHADGG